MAEMKEKGLLIVVSGPSASGKGTVNAYVLADEHFDYSVSATTRKPRWYETDGKDYLFITRDAFEKMIADDAMLEYSTFCDDYYGTIHKLVEEKRNAGKHVILEIEVKGAMQVREKYPDAVLIMLLPPSFAEQERRLRARNTETEEKIQDRLKTTREEVPLVDQYDYIVYNETGKAKEAAENILAIARAERCAIRRNPNVAKKYFSDENV